MTSRDLFTTEKLFCPGPTPVPEHVAAAMQRSNCYHRTAEFGAHLKNCRKLLAPLFGTKQEPLILACSGTGAMEAAVVNLTEPGAQVVAVVGGKFGDRWRQLNETYGNKVEVIAVEWGAAASPAEVSDRVKSLGNVSAVFFQANETSTGVHHPVEEIAKKLRTHYQGFIVVDAISSLGARGMAMDEWGIDCVVSGSQKGFGIPPGLAFIALSERARDYLGKNSRPRFYFDLAKEFATQAKGMSAWTPATTLIFGLEAALEDMHRVGLPELAAHHEWLASAARAAAPAMNLELLASSHHSPALTAMRLPEGFDGAGLVKHLAARFQAYFAGGQDQLKGKIIRVSHLGLTNRFDLLQAISTLEFGLREMGHQHELGNGVQEAMKALSNKASS